MLPMAEFQLDRFNDALTASGHSQSSLARSLGVTQGTISKIILGQTSNSRHIPRIAMELGVSLQWLFAISEDPYAPDPYDYNDRPPLHAQVTLPVSLPSEAALAHAFAGVLRASEKLNLDELAVELAKRLPTVLRRAAGAVQLPMSGFDENASAPRSSRDDVQSKHPSGLRR